jgi:ribosomal protein S18 acetylase RimI-like enzyme
MAQPPAARTPPLEIERLDGRSTRELLAFCTAHPAADLDPAVVRALLTHLAPSPAHVLDLAIAGQRVMVASVVDTVDNADRSALVALLGCSDDPARAAAALAPALTLAEDLVRTGNRSLVDVPLPVRLARHAPVLFARGYRPAYREQLMARPARRPEDQAPVAAGDRWTDGHAGDAEALHALAHAAFAGAPGWQGTDVDAARTQLRDASIPPRLLWRGGLLAGYVRVSVDDGIGTIHVIARRPEQRGRGVGRLLLLEAVRQLHVRGARELRLEVAAANRAAIALYQAHGFAVTGEQVTYRREIDRDQ